MSDSLRSNVLSENGTLVRVRSGHARDVGYRCPERIAVEVHPGLPRPGTGGHARTGGGSSPIQALDKILDSVEFDRLDPAEAIRRWHDRADPHPGLARWVAHAVTNVLAAEAKIDDLPAGLTPVSRWWARQRPATPDGVGTYEETLRGRRYETADGIREIRLLRTHSVDDRPKGERPADDREGEAPDADDRGVEQRAADDREVAFAAGVAAGGSPVLSNPWSRTAYRLGRFAAPRRIRVVEIGCVDGSARVRFDGTPWEAADRYTAVIAKALRTVTAGGAHRPGYDCGRCALITDCPAVPSLPGLLGVTAATPPRRNWSITTGREHRRCPARAYFRGQFLPGDRSVEESPATHRGRGVHHWIEQRHRATPHHACRASDVPDSVRSWESGGWNVVGAQARLGVQMIGDHALICPLRGLPDGAKVLPEHLVVVFDPDANVVVVSKADLLYQDADGWILRETKSRRSPGGSGLREFPQLALAALLSASGVYAERETPLRVELERLTPAGPILTRFDVTDPAVLAHARQVVTGLAADWFVDADHPTKPGKACLDCPFTRWCPDARPGRS